MNVKNKTELPANVSKMFGFLFFKFQCLEHFQKQKTIVTLYFGVTIFQNFATMNC